MNDDLGDRQKLYEGIESDRRFMPLLPICCRLDGKNFSKFTKGLKRPHDTLFSRLMLNTTYELVKETCACIGYTQSDEISLVYYSNDIKSQVFFDGRIQKMCSVLASMCSVYFNGLLQGIAEEMNESAKNEMDKQEALVWSKKANQSPIFDCRVWTVPNQIEACNYLAFREHDATRNSISMAASEYYSDKELFKKNSSEKQELLFSKGINWNNYPIHFKRGTYIQRRKVLRPFTTEEIDNLPEKHEAINNPNLMVERTEVRELDLPPLNKVINKIEVVFEGKDPIINEEKNENKTN